MAHDVSTATTRDDSLSRLEVFNTLLAATRERLGSLQPELETEEQQLERAQTDLADRLGAFARTVTAGPRDLMETALRSAFSSLAAVTGLANEMTNIRMAEGQRVVQRLETILEQGVATGREGLTRLGDHTRSGLEDVENGGADMESGADEGDQDTAARVAEMQAEMDAMRAALADAGADMERLLMDTDSYLANALARYVAGVFDTFRAHLAQEAQPYVVDAIETATVGATRGHDDLRAVVETVSSRLEDSTVQLVDDAHDRIQDLLKDREKDEERLQNEGIGPLREELARNLSALTDANAIVNTLQPLVPQLVSAKQVVEEIDDMMHFSME